MDILRIPSQICGGIIILALSPEKNHDLFGYLPDLHYLCSANGESPAC